MSEVNAKTTLTYKANWPENATFEIRESGVLLVWNEDKTELYGGYGPDAWHDFRTKAGLEATK